MSRIGHAIIEIPAGVTITEKDGFVTVKGPKGELTQELTSGITLEQNEGKLNVTVHQILSSTKPFTVFTEP